MSIYEYDEEKHLRMEREDAKADGIAEGIEIGLERGIEQGTELGVQKINQLNLKLCELHRTDDMMKAIEDSEYQKKLLEEFGLL